MGDVICTFAFDGTVDTDGAFSDSGLVTLPQDGAFAGGIITAAVTAFTGNIDFTRIWLTDAAMNEFDFTLSPTGQFEVGTIGANLAGGAYTFNITGTATGSPASYGGDLTFSAVPEPGTWGLMLLGFGLLGFAIRRRKPTVESVRVRYI